MIEVYDLSFTYPGAAERTLQKLDFSIQQGEIFGFLGPSGAGKSTTQKIIIGLLKKYQGSVRVMGRELRDLGTDYYEQIGVSFELPNLYSKFTARENLDYFRSFYAGETEEPGELLAMVDLAEAADTRVARFSKGMKMRLNFCRAFLNKPKLVFLDEPTSGLDPVNAKRIKDIILAQKAAGKTVFLTTHNMQVAEDLCDRVAFIVDGEIALIDAPHKLKLERSKRTLRVEYAENGQRETAEFDLQSFGTNEAFLRLVREKDILTVHSQEATLEEIFIEVTGRGLR